MQFKAWSYSALTGWETCPRQFHAVRIAKSWPDTKGEAAVWGDVVHKAIESRMKFGSPLPDTWGKPVEPLVARLLAAGPVQVEHKIAINANFQPVDYFAKDVWCRAIADVSLTTPTAIGTWDWKTGNYKDTTDQLDLSAAMQLSHFPHIDKAVIQYIWLKEGRTTTHQLTRADLPEVWSRFLPRVKRMQLGFESERWDAKPSGLCRKHCPVLNCEHNGRRK